MTSSKEQGQWGVTFIGDGATGKTSLVIQFAIGQFPEFYVPVVAENYVVEVHVGHNDQVQGESINLCIWDTPGQEDYPRLRPLAYANAHVILICFAIDDRISFENIEERWTEEARYERPGLPILVVGCKQDLRDDPTLAAAGQLIDWKEGSAMSQKIGAVGYLESSAKTGNGVADVFQVAAQQIILHQSKLKGKKASKHRCVIF